MLHLRNIVLFLILAAMVACGGSRHNEMLRQLERVEEMNREYVPIDTLQGMEELTEYFMAHGSAEERIRANYMMGSVLRDRGDSPMALEYFLKAASLADTTAADCNFRLLSRIYGQMGELFNTQRYPQKEIEMWATASSLALKADDTVAYLGFKGRVAGAFYWLKDFKSCFDIANDIYIKYKEIGRNDLATSFAITIADYYLQQDSLEQAYKLICEYEHDSGMVDSCENVIPGKELYFYYCGLYYEKSGQLEKALQYYKKLERTARDLMDFEGSYKGQMSVYKALGKSDSVFKYAQLFADANDSANAKHSADEVSRVQALFDYTAHKQRALEKTEENHALWRIVFIAAIALVAAVAAFWIYRIRQRQKQQSLHQQIARLRQFERMQQEQNATAAARQDLTRQKLVESAAHELLKQRMAEDKPLNDADIALIDETVNKACDGFKSTLYSAYNLSAQEYAVCLLLKFELSATDISRLLNRTNSAITMGRKRLFRKLFGRDGEANELDTYIRSL